MVGFLVFKIQIDYKNYVNKGIKERETFKSIPVFIYKYIHTYVYMYIHIY